MVYAIIALVFGLVVLVVSWGVGAVKKASAQDRSNTFKL